MEHRVYSAHRVWQANRERVRPSLCDDCIGSKVLVGELLGWARRSEIFSFYEDLIANFEVGRRQALRISWTLIALLRAGHLGAEELMEFVQVNCVVTRSGGSHIALRVYSHIRMVALVGEEWRYASSSTRRVVIGELGEGKEIRPVVLLIIAVDAQVLFQCLVGTFGLSIAFWVVPRGEVEMHVKCFTKRAEEVRDKFRTAIRCDVRGYTMLGENVEQEEFCEFRGCDGVVGRDKYCLLREAVDDDEDCSIAR